MVVQQPKRPPVPSMTRLKNSCRSLFKSLSSVRYWNVPRIDGRTDPGGECFGFTGFSRLTIFVSYLQNDALRLTTNSSSDHSSSAPPHHPCFGCRNSQQYCSCGALTVIVSQSRYRQFESFPNRVSDDTDWRRLAVILTLAKV